MLCADTDILGLRTLLLQGSQDVDVDWKLVRCSTSALRPALPLSKLSAPYALRWSHLRLSGSTALQ